MIQMIKMRINPLWMGTIEVEGLTCSSVKVAAM